MRLKDAHGMASLVPDLEIQLKVNHNFQVRPTIMLARDTFPLRKRLGKFYVEI